jgi:FAD:protein FMN transferase
MILRCKPLLGTFVSLKLSEESSSAYLAVEEALEEIEEIHNLMSFFDEKSDITLLNQNAHKEAVSIDPRLFEVLSLAQEISKISGGIFDITLHRSDPEFGSNFSDIELLENFQVRFKKPLQIDLGGIAKGYAVDRAAQILENYGIKDYVVNAGGDMRVGKSMQKISIRNPRKVESAIYETELCEESLATSSGYFSYQEVGDGSEKKRIYPIFQPNSKYLANAMEYRDESVSVFTKNCILADALTKVVIILKEGSAEILSKFNARAMLVTPSNQIKFLH